MAFRLTLTGVGAMNSPRFAPAGLLVELDAVRVRIDGGGEQVTPGLLSAWLVTDERAELISAIRRAAIGAGVVAAAADFVRDALAIHRRPVVHTSHETFGYLLEAEGRRIAWAPEFLLFPTWAAGSDLMLADGSAWDRPIRFAGRAGGHAAVVDTARQARAYAVRRLVFAHIGRPTIRAMDRGLRPPYGAFGQDGMRFEPRRWPAGVR